MASKYLMQIVHRDSGEVVQFEPGLSVEKDFVEAVAQRVATLGVGVTRTTAHVQRAVRTALELELLELKTRIKPTPQQ